MSSRLVRRFPNTVAAFLLLALLLPLPSAAGGPRARVPSIPVATYSIVARDAATGQLGVAVQSHWFSVGPIVPWAEAGVGAVATQSLVDPAYGPLGLEMMRMGKSAREALDGLLASDPGREVRQVAMIDARGVVAVHTGARAIAQAGHTTGDGFSVQANIMESERVWPAMAAAYRAAEAAGLDLAERLLLALEAAEREGGDLRGRQSAALLVVRGEPSGKPWADRLFDLRVEDAPAPLAELRRLLGLARAYEHMNRGDVLVEEAKWDEALDAYAAAGRLAPDVVEIPFWQALTLYNAGRTEEALALFRDVFRRERRWVELVRRLPAAELLTAEAARAILAVAPKERQEDEGRR